jgi:hypothetical protein
VRSCNNRDDEMGGYVAVLRRLKMHTIFWLENLKGRDHSEDLDADMRIILEYHVKERGWEVVYWAHLAQERDQ